MSRAEREAWRAQMAADPALRAAWDDYRAKLAAAASQIVAGDEPDLDDLRRAMQGVMHEADEDAPRH